MPRDEYRISDWDFVLEGPTEKLVAAYRQKLSEENVRHSKALHAIAIEFGILEKQITVYKTIVLQDNCSPEEVELR
jgi:hypothetical protein